MSQDAQPTLPAATCVACDREVVVEWELDGDQLVSLCIHCGDGVEVTHHIDLERAMALGYVAPEFEEAHGERGCRDGACGVQQPGV